MYKRKRITKENGKIVMTEIKNLTGVLEDPKGKTTQGMQNDGTSYKDLYEILYSELLDNIRSIKALKKRSEEIKEIMLEIMPTAYENNIIAETQREGGQVEVK